MTEMLNKEFSRKTFVKGGGALIVGLASGGALASAGTAAETISWIRSPMARSSAGILARVSRMSFRPSARCSSGLRPAAAFRSRAVAATAARSASLKTLSSLRACFVGMS